jgi:hypothetical protein
MTSSETIRIVSTLFPSRTGPQRGIFAPKRCVFKCTTNNFRRTHDINEAIVLNITLFLEWYNDEFGNDTHRVDAVPLENWTAKGHLRTGTSTTTSELSEPLVVEVPVRRCPFAVQFSRGTASTRCVSFPPFRLGNKSTTPGKYIGDKRSSTEPINRYNDEFGNITLFLE